MNGPFFSTQVAVSVPFDNSTNGFVAQEVQTAIEEAQSAFTSIRVTNVNSSLVLNYNTGSCNINGTYYLLTSGTVTVGANLTNCIVYVDTDGVVKAGTVAGIYPLGAVPLAKFTSNGTIVTNLVDQRSSINNNAGSLGIFGDGSDGSIVLDGTTNFTGFSTRVGTVYTLTRTLYAINLTINAGVTLAPSNQKIYVNGTLLNSGTIDSNGASGANGSGANGGASGAGIAAGEFNLSPAGGTGGAGNPGGKGGNSTTGSAGTATTSQGGGNGGAGGASGGGTAGGAAATATNRAVRTLENYLSYGGLGNSLAGGASGGGGGGGTTATGGGGGGGGGGAGINFIYALIFNNVGTIRANGGNGGNGGNGSSGGTAGGGGGGGGAGSNYLIFGQLLALGTVTVTGGSGGAVGTGGGSPVPVAGVAGGSGLTIKLNLSTGVWS